MNIRNRVVNIAQQRWLIWIAIMLTAVFCVEAVASYSVNPVNSLNGYIRRGIEYTLLNILYLIWLAEKIWHREPAYQANENRIPSRHFSSLLKASFIFLIAALICYPSTSDPYLYLHYGTMSLNGVNPYLTPAKDFVSQFSSLSPWTQASTYGPISTGFFMISAAGSSSPVISIYILKVLFFSVHIINAYLIWKEFSLSSDQSLITLAYLINPIILFEQVGNARVDVLLCTALILLIKFLRKGNYIGSIIAAWFGVLSKTLPIIWLPVLGVFLLKTRRWRSIAIAAFLSVLLLLVLSQTLFTEPKAWISLLNPGVRWQSAGSFHDIFNSLLSFAKPVLPTLLVEKQAGIVSLFKTLTYLLYCFYYAWICFKVYFNRQYTAANLAVELGWLTLTLFLFATPWYQPWYATILLCFVALLNFDTPFFCLTALLYSICSTVAYYVFSGASAQIPLFIASLITVVPTTTFLLLKFKSRCSEIKALNSES